MRVARAAASRQTGATGQRLAEAKNINKSLSALADVFAAKAAGSSHTPFRNSKLTHLMEPCLSGHGKTLMMVNVAPEAANSHESLCSLRFAKQVNQCDTGGKAKRSAKPAAGGAPGGGLPWCSRRRRPSSQRSRRRRPSPWLPWCSRRRRPSSRRSRRRRPSPWQPWCCLQLSSQLFNLRSIQHYLLVCLIEHSLSGLPNLDEHPSIKTLSTQAENTINTAFHHGCPAGG